MTRRTLVCSTTARCLCAKAATAAARVVTNAGQGDQLLILNRDVAAVLVADDNRRCAQPQCPTRVPRSSGTNYVRVGCRGQIRWLRPSAHPRVPGRNNPGDGCLLQHHFTNKDAPRRASVVAPRQVTGVGREPGDTPSPGTSTNCPSRVCDTVRNGWCADIISRS